MASLFQDSLFFFLEPWCLSNSTGCSDLWSVLGKVEAVFTPRDCVSWFLCETLSFIMTFYVDFSYC